VRILAVVFMGAMCAWAQTPCICDAKIPETLNARQCSLSKVTEEQPAGIRVFFLPDECSASPT
jgi:hypothetical protein